MIRVLRIINRLNLGGPTYNAAYLTRYLEPAYKTLLVSGQRDETEAGSEFIVRQMGIEPHYIPSMYREIHPARDWKSYRHIRKIIRQFKPHIVHTHAAKSGAVGRLAAYHEGVPVIVHTFHGHVFHSYFSKWKTRTFLEIERYLARISDCIIAISNLQKKELGEDFKVCSPDKIEVVPLGFKLDRFMKNQEEKRRRFREQYHLDDDEIAIGIVGRLVPVKNHDLFIKAIAQLKEKTSRKIRAFIIGDGEERDRLFALTKSLGLPFVYNGQLGGKTLVTYTSWITEVEEVMAGLDIVALTSFNEGTPVSLIEAQAANKPIVSTDVGGIADVVIPGKTALLSPPGDVETFAGNLLTLVENDRLRNEIGNMGYEHVSVKFHYQRLVNDMDSLYSRLLAQKGIRVTRDEFSVI